MMAFMQTFLTQASELACVENAQGTHRALTCASRLLRHMSDTGLAPLEDELEGLADYLSILKARFGNRFHLMDFRAVEWFEGLFVERARVISFVDEQIDVERLLNDPDVEYHIDCQRRLDAALRVVVREGGEGAAEAVCDLRL